ncbi:MAG: DNA mismatch repair endonuclease MutL [Polyangiaceae bacterium]
MSEQPQKIRRLSDDLVNQIAAGEVVERPASVVKELVENAVDAGATKIKVEIEQGGLSRIRVTDDGEGMTKADAVLALERHATSKITRFDDLMALSTFGFRGEALPSIASVARLGLVTRRHEDDEGTEIVIEGGGPARIRPTGCAGGTSIEIRDLFFNVPARRKFLKATGTESAHVGEAVLLAALAKPEISFVLARDGRVAREYLRVGTRQERAAKAIGEERLEACYGERGPLRIEAHLASPERARAGAVALYIFVNGRPVKDRHIARAVAQSYGSVLEPGRYPVGVLYIDLPSDLVDVNVHPQKAEVRFTDARAVLDAVTRELYQSISHAFAIPALGPPSRPWLKPQAPRDRPSTIPPSSMISDPTFPFASRPQSFTSETLPESQRGLYIPTPPPSGLMLSELLAASPFPPRVYDSSSQPSPIQRQPILNEGQNADLFARAGFYGKLTYLAQASATYLICEGEDGIYILDQHAAAERVTFDRLRRAFGSRAIASQRLLVPEVIELGAHEMIALEEHANEIALLGVEARAVGPTTVAVHGVPKILARAQPERLVRDLIAEMTREAGRPFGGAVDLVLATMACHGSVRAGDVLSREEAVALLRALDTVDFSGHCPHGRPVVTRMAFSELERRVGR